MIFLRFFGKNKIYSKKKKMQKRSYNIYKWSRNLQETFEECLSIEVTGSALNSLGVSFESSPQSRSYKK